ncbi:MAG: methionyl-tRNA formyltransferase [Chloroflexi bacterium]|nr:methionyl-tRNA formyltransferase [Chloroflexota bacterium]MDA1270368.1 methionyl-tRNA formyltransferase [Chloroflexota bacterium]
MRLVFMGTPTFAVPVLAGLTHLEGWDVAGVYTPPDRPAGRGRREQSSPVKDFALELGLPVFQPASLRSAAAQSELAKLKPDAIIVAAYGKLLPKPVLEAAPLGCLNIHPSLLPKHRGPSPVATAILEGDRVTGVTLMLLDEGMDTGPLIAQEEYALAGEETAVGLTQTLFELGGQLLKRTLPRWQSGELKATPQDDALATVTRKLERSDGLADWTLTAEELDRRSRAFTPWPGLFTHWNGSGLKLVAVSVLPGGSGGEPGLVVESGDPDAPAAVVTAQGLLGLRTVQLEGKRAVPAGDFLRGAPGFIGARL